MGRPKLEIDEGLVEKLAMIHCTHEEIAAVVGCSTDTIADRFSDLIKKARGQGEASLRRRQYKAAEEGNITMLIWLGKQHLGQSDKREITTDATITTRREDDFSDWLRDHPELTEPIVDSYSGNGGKGRP